MTATAPAPDPPGVDDPVPSLRRLSTTCSSDPPEAATRRTGLDPTECQADGNDASSNLHSSMTSQRSDRSGGDGGALVLYEPPASPGSGSDPPNEEEQEARDPPKPRQKDDTAIRAGALVKLDPKAIKESHPARTHGRELVAASKPPPAEDMIRGFDHCFVTVPAKERLSVLFATLRRSAERKVIVVCSTWESSQFYAILFRQFEMLHVYELHENMEKSDIARAYDEFVYLYPGILFASEIALREFDLPANIDYIIQFEPPMNPTEYIYRHSNAKIYKTSCHKALLFLTPDEMRFLEYFDRIENRELEARRVLEFQEKAEKLVAKHGELNDHAWKAFRAFVLAYKAHSHKDIYDGKNKLDEAEVRRSFGMPHLPEYSSKYFNYNQKASEKKEEKDEGDKGGGQNQQQSWRQRNGQKDGNDKPHQWMDKEKTWRKTRKPHEWMEKDKKLWKHTHVNI